MPLLLEGFDFGTPAIADHLTGTLAPLKRYNGLPIVASYFEEAMARLRNKHLNIALDAVPHPPSPLAAEAARYQQAVAATAPQVEEQELSAEQWFERGWEASEPAEKIRCFTEALRLNPSHTFALIGRAEARANLGDNSGAETDYEACLQIDPQSEFCFWSRASTRYDRGDLAEALRDINEAIRLKPEDGFNFSLRARIRVSDEPSNALADINKAILIDPKHGSMYTFRAGLLSSLGRLDEALEDLNEAVRVAPDEYTSFFSRARFWFERGEAARALEDVQRAISLHSDSEYLYSFRSAVVLALNADRTAAIADVERALEFAQAHGNQRMFDSLRDSLKTLREKLEH